MPYVYILKCCDGSFYTGSTWNLKRKVLEHKSAEGSKYTKSHLPVELVYFEKFERIDEAFKREKQLQGWSHKKKKALIGKNIEILKQESECKNESHYKNFNHVE